MTRRRRIAVTLLAGLAGLVAAAGPLAVPAAAAAPGSLDPSFNASGVATLGSDTQLFGVAVQHDGQVVAVGQSSGSVLVVRYNSGGALDAQYTGAAGAARAVAIQPDGRIVVAGTSGGSMFVERLSSALAPDPSFGSGGVATQFGGQSGVANGVTVAPDGSIVAAGTVGSPQTSVAVARFDAQGHGLWSESFNPLGLPYGKAAAVTTQPDGRIVIAGSEQGDPAYAFYNALVMRLNPGGSLDSSFAGSGVVSYHQAGTGSGYTAFNAITVQNDGKILAAGTDSGVPDVVFLRLLSNGALDPGFGTGGNATLASGQNSTADYPGGYGVGIAGGGRLIAAGSFEHTTSDVDAALWALTPAGQAETTFGSGGTVRDPAVQHENCALAIAPDGSLLTAGDTVSPFGNPNPCAGGGASGSFIPAGFVARYIGYGPPPSGSTPPPSPGPAPTVSTGAASGVSEVAAELHGTVNPNGASTSYQFVYGKTTGYGSHAGDGTLGSAAGVSGHLTGLAPGITYHYRLVATNAHGTTDGAERTFKTAPRVKVTLPGLRRQYTLGTIEHNRLILHVRCSQPCSISAALIVPAATARHLKLARRQLKVAGGSARRTRAGIARVRLRLHLARKLRSAFGHVHLLTLTLAVRPLSGGPTIHISRKLTLQG